MRTADARLFSPRMLSRAIRRSVEIALLVVSLLLLLATSQVPNSDKWESVGPGGGGALFSPAVNPHDPNRVLVACDMTGSYRTDDGGQSWHLFNLRGRVRWFVFDPKDQNVVYARSVGLWRSDNGGQTWKLIYPAPDQVSGIAMLDDHASESFITKQPVGSITALAVDPANSSMLYAALDRGKSHFIVRSKDYFKHYDEIAPISDSVQQIYVDGGSPPDDRSLYGVSNRSVFTIKRGSLQNGTVLPEVSSTIQVALSFPQGSAYPTVYAIEDNKILISQDGGSSWRSSELPGKDAPLSAIAVSPTDPQTAYVAYSGSKGGWFSSASTGTGIARTNDAGKTWQLSGKSCEVVRDGWISQIFGCGYAGPALGLAVAPSNPNVVYATDEGRVLRSDDAGQSWNSVYSTEHEGQAFSGRGLENTTAYGVHFDPYDPHRIFISYTDIGLFRSENGGSTWISSSDGMPAAWRNNAYWMIFDPEVRNRVWAVVSKTHDLPRSKMWRRKSPSDYDGGVVFSEDGGRSWRKSSEGMPPTAPTHILLDPHSSPDARVLYVAAFGRGVYKSVDGGKTWRLKNNGISGNQPFAWRLVSGLNGDIYLIVARRSDDGTIGNDDDGAIYHSTDGAEHWTKLALPEGVNGPNGLAVESQQPNRLYLAAWGRNTSSFPQGGGVFRSTDSGKSWHNVLSRDQHVYDVTIDPGNPNLLYAAGFESSLWRSQDRGNTWQRIPGFNFKWSHRVVPDPLNDSRVFVTTFGGGVWHGPARGDPHATDEIVSPQVAHGK